MQAVTLDRAARVARCRRLLIAELVHFGHGRPSLEPLDLGALLTLKHRTLRHLMRAPGPIG